MNALMILYFLQSCENDPETDNTISTSEPFKRQRQSDQVNVIAREIKIHEYLFFWTD
jgi:hypothetical protein